jgi:hypothetical protein
VAFWAEIGPGAQQAVELVNGLGLKQLRYLLLAILRDFAADKTDSVRRKRQCAAVRRIAAWSVRGLVHERIGGGEAERAYISTAAEVRTGAISSVEQLREAFVDRKILILDDDLFKRAFTAFAFDRASSHKRAGAIVTALEFAKMSDKSGLVPKGTLTVEHVLPLSREPGQWTQFDGDEVQVYAHKLGNLLLIDGPSKANQKLRNKEWPAKKKLIKEWGSQTPLTAEAMKYPQWTKSTIDRRTKELAALAVAAWSVD